MDLQRALTGFVFMALLIGIMATGAAIKGSVLAQPAPVRARALDVSYRYLSVGWIDWVTVQLSEAAESAQSNEDLVEALLVLGLTYESSDNVQAARETYSRLIHTADLKATDLAMGYALLGRLELGQQRPRQAKALLLEADRLVPDQASVVYGLGQAAESEGDFEDAVRLYTRAHEISKEWLAPIVRAAAIHKRQGDPAKAASLLVSARLLGTRDVEYHTLLGESFAGILSAYTTSPSVFPIDQELATSLGIDLQEIDTSLVALIRHAAERALQLEPGHPGAQQLLERLPAPADL